MLQRLLRIIQVLRLIMLMLVGSAFGQLPIVSHSPTEAAEHQLRGAILGALGGLTVELVLRTIMPPLPQRDFPPVRFSVRALLISITVVAVVLGLVICATKR